MGRGYQDTKRINRQIIERGKSPKGGYTNAQLAVWGLRWPLKSGWKKRLINGPLLSEQKADKYTDSPKQQSIFISSLAKETAKAWGIKPELSQQLYDWVSQARAPRSDKGVVLTSLLRRNSKYAKKS